MKPIQVPITGELDLHTFDPRDVRDLIDDYFSACREAGIYSVRVVHGKGSGILRSRVASILKRHPQVQTFRTAPPEAGGWGATVVELKKN